MIPERDFLLATFEVEQRRRMAAEARAARAARRARTTNQSVKSEPEQAPDKRPGWLRRLAGARN